MPDKGPTVQMSIIGNSSQQKMEWIIFCMSHLIKVPFLIVFKYYGGNFVEMGMMGHDYVTITVMEVM